MPLLMTPVPPPRVDRYARTNQTFKVRIQVTIPSTGGTLDLTNHKFKMRVRPKPGSATTVVFASNDPADAGDVSEGSTVTIDADPTTGFVTIMLPTTFLETLPTGPAPLGWYDVVMYRPDDTQKVLFEGQFYVARGIT